MQIVEVTRRIQQNPNDAALYLKRGELHRAVRDWDAALADYDRAAHLAPRMHAVELARGTMLLEAGRPEEAKVALDRFLVRLPDHGEALIARARALAKLGRLEAAADDYTRGIARLPAPRPEYYLERAEALVGARRSDEALRGLDEGVRKLGPLVTLELAAVDLELREKRYDAALARLERIAAQSARKETWLARRGDILRQAGRPGEARIAYRAALAAIESLPAGRRNTKATAELEQRIRSALGRSPAQSKRG